MAEALGVAGHGGVEDLADLAAEQSVFVDEIAAVPTEELQG
jgi:hypothetical protein